MIANLLFKTAVEQDNNININMKEYFHIYVLQSRHIMRDVPPHICNIIIIIDEGGSLFIFPIPHSAVLNSL